MSVSFESSSQPPVLIGFAEALSAPEVAWSLVDAGHSVTAFSRKGRSCALRSSRYVQVHEITAPDQSSELSRRDLQNLMRHLGGSRSNSRNILFPLDDASVWLTSGVDLPPSWLLAGPSKEQALFALDKSVQVKTAESSGLNTPHSIVLKDKHSATSIHLSFPVILKPARAINEVASKLRKGANWICSNITEYERSLALWDERYPLLLQSLIPGTGEGVFGLATESGVLAWSAHRRVRMMNPHGSGSSACISRPVDENLKKPIEWMLATIQWRGLFMIELLRDSAGKAWLIEFNGRPWGSMALARRQGLEYPAWHVQQTLGDQCGAPGDTGTFQEILCRNLGREIMHLLFVIRGPRSAALASWPRIFDSLKGVLSISSKSRLSNWRRDDANVFLSDCCHTVRDQLFKSKA